MKHWLEMGLLRVLQPFKRKPHKMVKHAETIRQQIADELF